MQLCVCVCVGVWYAVFHEVVRGGREAKQAGNMINGTFPSISRVCSELLGMYNEPMVCVCVCVCVCACALILCA